jgi:hypothetical protein
MAGAHTHPARAYPGCMCSSYLTNYDSFSSAISRMKGQNKSETVGDSMPAFFFFFFFLK